MARDQVRMMTDTKHTKRNNNKICPYCGSTRIIFNDYIGKFKCMKCDKFFN